MSLGSSSMRGPRRLYRDEGIDRGDGATRVGQREERREAKGPSPSIQVAGRRGGTNSKDFAGVY